MAIPINLIPGNAAQLQLQQEVDSTTSLVSQFNPRALADKQKIERQIASVKSLTDELDRQENPFTYRKSLEAKVQKNSVLGRFNTRG